MTGRFALPLQLRLAGVQFQLRMVSRLAIAGNRGSCRARCVGGTGSPDGAAGQSAPATPIYRGAHFGRHATPRTASGQADASLETAAPTLRELLRYSCKALG